MAGDVVLAAFAASYPGAVIAVALALLLAYGARLWRGWFFDGLNRLVGLGYAVPGSVIAVGVLIPVTRLDHWIAAQWAAISEGVPCGKAAERSVPCGVESVPLKVS